ncbi:hypothetical protein PRIPAC_94132, partial [Pristionchus pacificus]|uniref:Uncharacterized protein n=1 Tax=Pristionchus pacificus TaxID=54126 RepID=A0A2A6CHG3_PRIPA
MKVHSTATDALIRMVKTASHLVHSELRKTPARFWLENFGFPTTRNRLERGCETGASMCHFCHPNPYPCLEGRMAVPHVGE